MEKRTNDNSDVKAILKQTENKITRQDGSIEAMKSLARLIFGASSVVIPLFGTLQIFSQVPETVKVLYAIIVAIMGLLYGILVVYCLKVLDASPYYGPIEMSLDVLIDSFMHKEERDVILMEISANMNAINKNAPSIEQKKTWTRVVGFIFPAIVLLALVATLLSKIF